MDTGEVQSIAGVATQGRRDAAQWVTSIIVQVSDDGKKWQDVECGRTYDANEDQTTLVKILFDNPVKGRFVRILPQTYYGWMSMRAAVLLCERPCLRDTLVYTFRDSSLLSSTKGPSLETFWGEGTFDDKKGYRFGAGQGLVVEQARCISGPAYTIYIKASLDSVGNSIIMSSDGWGDSGVYVKSKFQTMPVASQLICQEIIRPGISYQYVIVRNDKGDLKLYLNGYLCASGSPPYNGKFTLDPEGLWFFHSNDLSENSAGNVRKIQLWNRAMSDAEVRGECGCELPANGKACEFSNTYVPTYLKMRFSSSYNNDPPGYSHGLGRLNSVQAWSAAQLAVGEYMELEIGEEVSVSGIITQGRSNVGQWVTAYKVQVSKDRKTWKDVECGRTFTANSDMFSKVTNMFDNPVLATYVRILPQTWYGWMSMRAGLLLCERPCIDHKLDYPMTDSLLSITRGPGLEALWGDGTFVATLGYRFGAGQGLSVDEGRCIDGKAYTIYLEARLDTTSGWRRIIGANGWGDNGLYVN